MTTERPAEIGLSALLPVFNERDSLRRLDAELRAALEATGRVAEILYVDDGSTDGSPEILLELVEAARGSAIRTRFVKLRRNYGQTAAIAAGFDLARGEVVIPLDADGQNDPADIPRLLDALDSGYDVVSGWRRDRKDRMLSRRLPSAIANRVISWFCGLELHDFGCTLKAYRSRLLREIHLYGDMHRFLPVYLARIGARVGEIEVAHRPRRAGESKYGGGRVIPVLLDLVLVLFFSRFYVRPMQFFGRLALLLAAALGLTLGWMLTLKYGWLRWVGYDYRASFIETPLPSLAGILLIGMVLSLFSGILAEILIRIHHESMGVRSFAVQRVADSHPPPGAGA